MISEDDYVDLFKDLDEKIGDEFGGIVYHSARVGEEDPHGKILPECEMRRRMPLPLRQTQVPTSRKCLEMPSMEAALF